jgi:hypothetical protein
MKSASRITVVGPNSFGQQIAMKHQRSNKFDPTVL